MAVKPNPSGYVKSPDEPSMTHEEWTGSQHLTIGETVNPENFREAARLIRGQKQKHASTLADWLVAYADKLEGATS